MGMCVCQGATMNCSFGMTPSVLSVLPTARVMATGSVASIMDQIPFVNIAPFGMCSSMLNPAVAAATAAAMGVLTPMPCIPSIAAPWIPGSPLVLVGGFPALTSDSKAICAFGGVIQIAVPGTVGIVIG